MSVQDLRLYSWLRREQESHLYNQPKKEPFHVIAAVTDRALISMLVLTHTIKGEDFQSFLPDVVERMRQLHLSRDEPFVLLYDNAAVHRTKAVVQEVQRQECLAILNCTYAPDLTFCEKFIKLHKRRLQWHLN